MDLLPFSAGEMTWARATAAEVMGSEVPDSGVPGRALHDMPNRAVSTDSAKDGAGRNPGSLHPNIYGPFDPTRHRNGSDVFALAYPIGHAPVLLPDLKIFRM